MGAIDKIYKEANDIVSLTDVCMYLKSNDGEYQRKNEKEIEKFVRWQFESISKEISGTNIVRQLYRKRDFFESLKDAPMKKRDSKAANKESEVSKSLGNLSDFEETNEGKNLVAYESTNALNNMLPAVKKAHELQIPSKVLLL